nr:LytTR family DNA-binding domain-containing protein [uncultured Carboxylicivirga sp.]
MSNLINCLIVDDEITAREVLENHLSKIDNIHLIASCKNALEAFQWLAKKSIDLIFLDINMPEISGLDFAKTINRNCKIIFTTAYREYAIDGFDLRAVDYLLKPIAFERLLQSVQKYLDETPQIQKVSIEELQSDCNDFIFVRSDRKMVKIDFNDILYIESLSDYIRIHMTNQIITTRETISNIEVKLPTQDFIRTHRSYIIAIKHIKAFTHETIEIANHELPISRSYKNEVIERLETL